ncbi:MAG: DUF4239 domain-containing protein [Parvibaculum sp.]|uniref:bestrophin-like domain n=1 Tax=Parvibaculum sp. TaxID=2024848 RepID=UPI00271AD3ED|nr:DUF4239 domain-containing protein [Parvibaculum sp.]MDO8838405.1 DUF4239 domain-containing protein [Parvibaculum sp.]
MFRFWLQFHPLLILPALIFIFAVSGGIIHWLQCRSPLRGRLVNGSLGLPTYVAVSTLFALFAAFLLADTMARKDRAAEAVQTEAAALLGLAVGSETAGEGGDAIRAAIRAYAGSVIADEWTRMIDESDSERTAQRLLELMRAVHDAPARSDISATVHGHMLALSQKIVDARADRIATVTFHFQSFSWSALFLLGFLTQFILGMGFLDRPASNRSVIVIFSLAAVVALWLIAIQDNPFRGPARISPAAFEAVAASGSE